MTLAASELSRLSTLLDDVLELDDAAREAWLAGLSEGDAKLAPTLRRLLEQHGAPETDDLLARGPAFNVPGGSPAAPAFKAGDTVGPYRLQREIGQGGMGEVWLAERTDGQLRRQVALKLPLLGLRRTVLVQRFARERDILGSLQHPNIARLYDAGLADDGQPYLALEYVEGRPITEYCEAERIDLRGRVKLVMQVAQAVQYAHANLVIHRDLKPDNVLVRADGQAMLLDFGIAKLVEGDQAEAAETELTREGGRALTLGYAAPEQVSGAPVSTATDVYALGALLYELLASTRPFNGARHEVEHAVLTQEPLRPKGAPADLATIVLKALKKLPAERYATANAFSEDLGRWLAGEAVLAQPDSRWYRTRKFVGRNRVGVGASAAVVAAALGASAVSIWQAREASEQARIADAQARKAEEESRHAEAVQGFMTGLFRANASRQKDPAKARATTARELLDLGAEQLKDTLKDLPEARADVMATLSEMYYQLELEDKAVELDRQRLELLRQTLGKDHVRVAGALILLAGSLHATGHRDEILPALDEAKRILDAAGDRGSHRRGELLVRLAQRNYNVSLAKAIAYADEAVAVLRAEPVVDHDMLGTALILGARARAATGELAEAQALFRGAIVELQRVPDRPHFDIMQARFSLAEVLGQQQQFGPALVLAREAAEEGAAALGAESPGVIAVHSRWGSMLHGLGQRELARKLQRRALDAMLKTKGPDDTLYTPIARIELARSLLAEGRLADSLALTERVMPMNRKHYAGSPVLAGTLRTQAALWATMGRHTEARHLVQEAEDIWQRGGGGAVRPWRFNRLVLDAARLDLAESKPDAALRTLERFSPWPDAESPSPRPDEIERDTLAALAQLERGDAAAALRLAQSAADAVAVVAARGRQPGLEADAALTQGLALMAGGQPAAARASIDRALSLRREFDDPNSPWRAQAEAAHGRCLLLLGQQTAARQAAARAQTIIAANPPLSEAFTQPLKDLRRALGREAGSKGKM